MLRDFPTFDGGKPSCTRQVWRRETDEAVTALQSLSVGREAADGKNNTFDLGGFIPRRRREERVLAHAEHGKCYGLQNDPSRFHEVQEQWQLQPL